ncbi:DUF4083 domain-containing protein [Neobacillus notoginsengisoli]|uniref:DUF4083 domain-containing protein n=1 Tax=Neobacillus notoginsengisoli TaxID=1578198 RepID=A0A417YZU3_9BACI|nr:DUF4083 family protein [Neobacillus notoginsengisoli]RHW43274.1 DUF4083 domain-containing protein [Neobacillus notoginsengisoli]
MFANVLFVIFFLFLILLFVLSFALFIRRLLINSSTTKHLMQETDRKLDRIIELLEQQAKQP